MKFYKRFCGDFLAKTSHLTMSEVGAYDRLLDHLYSTEKLLPKGLADCHRIARAMTKDERQAVQRVLLEFFTLTEGGWAHERALEVLAEARPKIEAARLNGAKGGRPKGRPKEPTGLFSDNTNDEKGETQTGDFAKASQSQSQITNTNTNTNTSAHFANPAEVCMAMKAAGMALVNPSNPVLTELLRSGATEADFVQVAAECVQSGKGFAYALATVKGRQQDAARQGAKPKKHAGFEKLDYAEGIADDGTFS
jgi:uncharacterized protein YdaU (DUF1376 family)